MRAGSEPAADTPRPYRHVVVAAVAEDDQHDAGGEERAADDERGGADHREGGAISRGIHAFLRAAQGGPALLFDDRFLVDGEAAGHRADHDAGDTKRTDPEAGVDQRRWYGLGI